MYKKLLIAALALGSALGASAKVGTSEYEAGDATVGVNTGYSDYTGSMKLGLETTYAFMPQLRIAGSAEYAFQYQGVSALAANADIQMPFSVGVEQLTIYPLVGANLTYGIYNKDAGDTTKLRAGVNVGAGVEYLVTPTFGIYGEDKYVFGNGHYSQFNVGVRFKF